MPRRVYTVRSAGAPSASSPRSNAPIGAATAGQAPRKPRPWQPARAPPRCRGASAPCRASVTLLRLARPQLRCCSTTAGCR